MQKIEKPISETLPPAKLFLEDFQEIFAFLQENTSEIRIQSDGYAFSDFEDFKANAKVPLQDLEVKAREPYVNLEFRPDSTWLFIGDSNASCRGLFETLKKIIVQRRRVLSRSWIVPTVVIVSMVATLILTTVGNKTGAAKFYQYAIALSVITVVASSAMIWCGVKSSLTLKARGDNPNFFMRKSDEILFTLGGSLATLLLQWIFGKS